MRHYQTYNLRYANGVRAMRQAVRNSYQGFCVISGMHRTDSDAEMYEIDAAHVLPASTFPEVSECIQNGLPIVRYRHCWRLPGHANGCLDLVNVNGHLRDRKPIERFEWLRDNVQDDFRAQVFDQLRTLVVDASSFSAVVLANRDRILRILEDV